MVTLGGDPKRINPLTPVDLVIDHSVMIDHFGTPLGVGPYASQREEIFAQWKVDIADIAALPNTVAKIGGLAMPDNGFGWNTLMFLCRFYRGKDFRIILELLLRNNVNVVQSVCCLSHSSM